MNQIEALKRLHALGTPAFGTRDAAAILAVTPANASMILRRLQKHGFLLHLARGRWALTDRLSRFALPEALSAPVPAYVSLQSGLFHHGMIEQIPAVVYAVTLGRPRRVSTRLDTGLGTVSFHRLPPELFTGFELAAGDGAKIATPEKALFDLLYLAPARSRLFNRLPELTLPRAYHWKALRRYAGLIISKSRREYVLRRINELMPGTS